MKAWLLEVLNGRRRCSPWWLLLAPAIGAVFALTFPEQPTGAWRAVAQALAAVNDLFASTNALARMSPHPELTAAYFGLMWLSVPLTVILLLSGSDWTSATMDFQRSGYRVVADFFIVAAATYLLTAEPVPWGTAYKLVSSRQHLSSMGWIHSSGVAMAIAVLSNRLSNWRKGYGRQQ